MNKERGLNCDICFERFNYEWVGTRRRVMESKESFFDFVNGSLDHVYKLIGKNQIKGKLVV